MKTFGSVVFALALSLASSLCLAGERKLEIATTEYPPYYGKDLENGGFMTEIVVEVFKRAGYDAEIKFLPWKRALEGRRRRLDGRLRRPGPRGWSASGALAASQGRGRPGGVALR